MSNIMLRLLAATAASGMAIAPLAAQSSGNDNTRAGSGAPLATSAQDATQGSAQPGTGRDRDDGESRIVGLPVGIAALFAAAASAGTIAVVDGGDGDGENDNDQSPGT